VTYDIREPHKLKSWGFPAIRDLRRSKQESETLTWFKLLLQPPRSTYLPLGNGELQSPSGSTIRLSSANLQPPNENGIPDLENLRKLLRTYKKSAEDVTVDFLREIWAYTKQELRLVLGENFMAQYSIKVVLTVPAVWTPETANLTRELAVKAGIQAEQLNLVQEPEAAAIAVAEVSSGRAQLREGDIITVCDAGGGTCVSFRLAIQNSLCSR
jgi:hypothetical protein